MVLLIKLLLLLLFLFQSAQGILYTALGLKFNRRAKLGGGEFLL